MLTKLSLWEMARFTTDIGSWDIVRAGLTQGLGLGFIFVPLPTIRFAMLAPHYRNEGTSLFSLARNIGSSIGISQVITQRLRQRQAKRGSGIRRTRRAPVGPRSGRRWAH